MSERLAESPKEIFVPITLNRASLGEAPYVFAKINPVPDSPAHIAYVPRKDIIVNEQPVGEEVSARLKVRVVEELQGGFLIETEDGGNPVRWKVDREGKIIPARSRPVFNT